MTRMNSANSTGGFQYGVACDDTILGRSLFRGGAEPRHLQLLRISKVISCPKAVPHKTTKSYQNASVSVPKIRPRAMRNENDRGVGRTR